MLKGHAKATQDSARSVAWKPFTLEKLKLITLLELIAYLMAATGVISRCNVMNLK